MGLDPLSPDSFSALPRETVLNTQGVVVDFEGDFQGMGGTATRADYRLHGLLLEQRGYGVFVKLVGPRQSVAESLEDFEQFVSSLRDITPSAEVFAAKRGASLPADHPPMETAQASTQRKAIPGLDAPPPEVHEIAGAGDKREAHGQRLIWEVPDGWVSASKRPMRLVTYSPNGREDVECYVTLLGSQAGGVHANLNRWLHQFGNPPISAPDIESLPMITMLDQPVHVLESSGTYTDMSGVSHEDYGLLGVAWVSERGSAFLKMIGPREIVEEELGNFVHFCESFRWHG